MKNLILSSIILILFSGCSSTMMKGFHHIPENMIDTAAVKPWFQGQSDHFLFQTNINIYKNHFGGIMVVKSLSLESHRVVYVTELGIKIFDMEFFKNGDFKLHYCMDEINKKYVIEESEAPKIDFTQIIESIAGKSIKENVSQSKSPLTVVK